MACTCGYASGGRMTCICDETAAAVAVAQPEPVVPMTVTIRPEKAVAKKAPKRKATVTAKATKPAKKK